MTVASHPKKLMQTLLTTVKNQSAQPNRRDKTRVGCGTEVNKKQTQNTGKTQQAPNDELGNHY